MNHKCGGGNIISSQFSPKIRIKCRFLCGTKKDAECVRAQTRKKSSMYKKSDEPTNPTGVYSIH